MPAEMENAEKQGREYCIAPSSVLELPTMYLSGLSFRV